MSSTYRWAIAVTAFVAICFVGRAIGFILFDVDPTTAEAVSIGIPAIFGTIAAIVALGDA